MTKRKGSRLVGAARPTNEGTKDRGVTDGIRANKKCCNNRVCMQSEVSYKTWLHSLGFLDLDILGKKVQALMDTGATHNFMTTNVAKEVGLQLLPTEVEVKAVNSRTKVSGLENKVLIRIGDW